MLDFFRFALHVSLGALLTTAALMGAANAAGRATKFEIDFFQNGSAEPMNHATIWISDRRVRIEQRRANALEKGPALVYRGDKDLVLSISDRDRGYSQIDRRMLRALGMQSPSSQRVEPRRAVDAQLKSLPGDQRAALERVLGITRSDAVAAPLVVTHGTAESTVADIQCKRVVMSRAEKPVGDACIASWDRIGFDQSDIEVFRALANFQRAALGARGLTPVEFVPDQAFDLIVQFDGFPLSFRRIVKGNERSAIRVRSIEQEPVDERLFSAPSGYARRAGYNAFMEHLSAADSSPSTGGNNVVSPPAAPAQPAASPAPIAREPKLNRRYRGGDRSYRRITLLP